MTRPIDLIDDDLWSLLQASHAGDEDQVRALLSRRPDLVRGEYNYTPALHFAVREGHLGVVRFLVEQGADLDYGTYPFQDSLLTMARDREHHEIARILLEMAERRFPVNEGIAGFLAAARRGDVAQIQAGLARDPGLAHASSDTGDTALHQAALGRHLEVVNLLLDAGANADAGRADGKRPVTCALQWMHGAALRGGVIAGILLARGAAYNIYLAAAIADIDYVRKALAADPALANFEDSSHHRPISAAAGRNDLEMVKLLLEHGANPSLPEEGAPLGLALWLAVYQGQREMAELLLRHGANPNTAPESSGSALTHTRKAPELRALLLKYGAREDTSDSKELEALIGENALQEVEAMLQRNPALLQDSLAFWGEGILSAPSNGRNREMIELLIRYGARVPQVSKWGPEYYFKHAEIGALLLERGMDPNHRNWHGFTLLHHVAAKGDLVKARLLLDHGAEIDAIDEEYRSTPLGCAARWGQREMAAFLLERGADPNRAGAVWSTPLAWAQKKGHAELEADLRRAGAGTIMR